MSNAPAAELSWMTMTTFTTPTCRPAPVRPSPAFSPSMTTYPSRRPRSLRGPRGMVFIGREGTRVSWGDRCRRAPPVGGDECRLFSLPRARHRHEDDMLDACPDGRVDSRDVLRRAPSGFQGLDDEQTIEARIGLRKAFRPVSLAESYAGLDRLLIIPTLEPARRSEEHTSELQ